MRTDDNDHLLEYIRELECRLRDYHSWLEQSIAERDRLCLDAAWGVHAALLATVALGLGLSGLAFAHKGDVWWQSGLAVLFCFVAPGIALRWSNKERMKEVDRLAALPEWHWKDPGLD